MVSSIRGNDIAGSATVSMAASLGKEFLELRMSMAIDVLPRLSRYKGELVRSNANDFAVRFMESANVEVQSSVHLGDNLQNREGDPQLWAWEFAQGMKPQVVGGGEKGGGQTDGGES